MTSTRSLFVVLAFGCLLGFGSSLVSGQQSNSEGPTSLSGTPLLRRVVIRHPGCVTCDDSILDSEGKYLDEHLKERPKVESVYQQKSADEMKQALRDFWAGRGVTVEVSTTLTQVTNAPHYAVLEFQVYRRY